MPPAARPPCRVPPPVDVPTPPRTRAALDPLLMSWPTGEVIYRGCDVHRGCRNFSAGNAAHPGRFQPCTAGRRRTPPPVLYGAGDVDTAPIDAALSETEFHDLPIRGSKHLAHAQLVHRLGVALIARRDLLLVDLTSDGPRRLGLTRGKLIESWHSTLEFELRRLVHFTTRAQARRAVADWIEDYNHDRRHSALGMPSPIAYERRYAPAPTHRNRQHDQPAPRAPTVAPSSPASRPRPAGGPTAQP